MTPTFEWLIIYFGGTLVALITALMDKEYLQVGDRKWTRYLCVFLWPVVLPVSILALLMTVAYFVLAFGLWLAGKMNGGFYIRGRKVSLVLTEEA